MAGTFLISFSWQMVNAAYDFAYRYLWILFVIGVLLYLSFAYDKKYKLKEESIDNYFWKLNVLPLCAVGYLIQLFIQSFR